MLEHKTDRKKLSRGLEVGLELKTRTSRPASKKFQRPDDENKKKFRIRMSAWVFDSDQLRCLFILG